MFFIYLLIFLALCGALCFFIWAPEADDEDVAVGFGIAAVFFFVVVLLVFLITNFATYSGQIKRFEEIRATNQKIILLEEKYSSLAKSFSYYLAEKYPAYEKEMFEKISPASAEGNLLALLSQYPELRSSETLGKLVDQISALAGDLYEKKLSLEDICKTIRYKEKSPWILILPKIPENLKGIIYR